MQKSNRTRRARTKHSGSSIPVRISSNEQTHKTVQSARSDSHCSSGEYSTTGDSNIVETIRSGYSTNSGGSGRDVSSMSHSDNVETIRSGYSTNSGGSGREVSSVSHSDNVETIRSGYSARSGGSGREITSMSNSDNVDTEKMICTSRSDASDGEITTVRQTFKIVGTIDKDNRCSMESLDSNKDSAFYGSQDLLCQQDNDSDYSQVKMIKTVSFEDVGSANNDKLWIKPSDDIKVELEEEVGEDEELLREELLRIFDRERFTLGNFFKNKMDELSRDYRKREMDLDEQTRAEMSELEQEVAQEKAEMQKVFANEIAALTRTFNEDRAGMEQFHKQQIKELREQFENDQQEREQKFQREKMEFQDKLESDFQAMLRAEISETKESTQQELKGQEERFQIDKLDMERRHSVRLSEAEMNTKKVKDELEMMFSQEKSRLEEGMVERIRELELQLKQEREMRIQLEALLEEEKLNVTSLDSAKRRESEALKSELEGLRFELDEKNKVAMEMSKLEEEIKMNGKNGLNGKLREDFDRIIEEHKQELERKYVMEKEELQKEKELELQKEKKKILIDVEYERKKMKEEIEKERENSMPATNGNREGIKQSSDYSQKRESNQRNEYSAHISYGNQEPQADGQFSREDRKYTDKGDEQKALYSDRSIQGHTTLDKKGYSTSYDQPRELQYRDTSSGENLIYYESSVLEQTKGHHCIDDYLSERPIQGGQQAQRGFQYNTYNSEVGKQPGLDRPHHDSSYNGNGSDGQPQSNASNHHTKDQTPSGVDPKSNLYYVTPGNENFLRSEINELRSENEGLKAKIEAMEENISLHKKYKAEAKEELGRLQKAKDELQSKINDTSREDAKMNHGKVDKLEKSLRESESQRKEFEAKVKELNDKLSDAEEKAQQAKKKASDLEVKIREHSGIQDKSASSSKRSPYGGYSRDAPGEEAAATVSKSKYQDPRSAQYGALTKYADDKREDPTKSVYGYPSVALSQSVDVLDCKKPHDGGTTAGLLSTGEPRSSWKNPEQKRGKCSGKCSAYSSKRKPTGEISSLSSPQPIYGSHERLGKSSDRQGRQCTPGRYSCFGGINEPGFNTSSPRKSDGRSYDNQGVSATNDDSLTKKEKYDKAVAERDKLVQLIKELKDKVEELYIEKERIDKEQKKLRKEPTRYNDGKHAPCNQSDLKSQVEEMQRKIKALAERLRRDSPRKHSCNDTYQSKPAMLDIEDLQYKLQRTGDAISHTNADPEALMRIEKEIKIIGELLKCHIGDDDQGCSTYRSEDNARVLQLQMDKQDLELKLNMAKDVMNDYVNRLSEKMENLEGANALSDATLQELYERNAKLKETLKALEKGQRRSEMQNGQLMQEKSALQDVIGQICNDASFCSQYSTPRESGYCCHDGSYGYTMTSQGQSKVPELNFSDRFSCY